MPTSHWGSRHTSAVLRSASLLMLCVVVATGCGRDSGSAGGAGLLAAKDLGGSWLRGSGDEGPGFDTGCVAAVWGTGRPPRYDYVNLVNPASVQTPGAAVTVDEYVLPMEADAALSTIDAFRTSLPACTASLAGVQEEPEQLVSLSSLPAAVVSTSTAGQLMGDVVPGSGREWTVLAPAPGRGLVWLTVTGGNAAEVTAIAQKAVQAATRPAA